VKTGYAGSVWRLAPNKNLIAKALCSLPDYVERELEGLGRALLFAPCG
jgi:hypothetical protein